MTPAQVAQAVFDSHRFVKRLTEAGMEEGLAEEHMGPWIRNVASKADVAAIREDLEDIRTTMRKDLEDVRTTMRDDLERTEANIRRDTATKADVAILRKDLEDTRTTMRDDLERTEANIRRDFATKADGAHRGEHPEGLRDERGRRGRAATHGRHHRRGRTSVRRAPPFAVVPASETGGPRWLGVGF